jgi:hypothetical protein
MIIIITNFSNLLFDQWLRFTLIDYVICEILENKQLIISFFKVV